MAAKTSLLSSVDVCRIIDSSAKAGVSELKFGDLHVTFGRPPGVPESNQVVPQVPASTNFETALSDKQHTDQAKESLEADEFRHKEDKLAMALVENPELYEQMIRDGELDESSEPGDDDEHE